MRIPVRIGKKKYWWEHDDNSGIDGFCAASIVCDFQLEELWWDKEWADEDYELKEWKEEKPVTPRGLFKRLIEENIREGMLFISDNIKGIAYQHVFPHVNKRPFYMTIKNQRWRLTPHKSKEFRNDNSRMMVQYITVVMEKA